MKQRYLFVMHPTTWNSGALSYIFTTIALFLYPWVVCGLKWKRGKRFWLELSLISYSFNCFPALGLGWFDMEPWSWVTYAETFKDQKEAEGNDFLVLPDRILFLRKIDWFSQDTIINAFDISGKLEVKFFFSP